LGVIFIIRISVGRSEDAAAAASSIDKGIILHQHLHCDNEPPIPPCKSDPALRLTSFEMGAKLCGRRRASPMQERAIGCLIFALAVGLGSAEGAPSRVEIRSEPAGFRLYRDGKPYFIKGAVFVGDQMDRFPLRGIAERGGNSIRSRPALLDQAGREGLTVLVNLPMKMEWADKFDYDDEEAVRRQFEQVREIVVQHKDHPAVLMWSIGNELSVRYTNKKVWDAVNAVARMIHEVDPNHPVMTVVGGLGEIADIRSRCPDLDLLGVNAYRDIDRVPARLRAAGWEKPYVVTEWGPSGDWQVRTTNWKAAIEETSTEKAQRYLERYTNVMLKDTERCLGSYVFIWQWRHERTQTWYGMFLESGEQTEAVHVMQYVWSGAWPSKRAPRVEPIRLDGAGSAESVVLKPGSRHHASVTANDPQGAALRFEWQIVGEVARAGYAGRGEQRPKPMPDLLLEAEGARLVFTAPGQDGAYRLFVFVRDGRGNAATANLPFLVQR
jgi:hypothetical protein